MLLAAGLFALGSGGALLLAKPRKVLSDLNLDAKELVMSSTKQMTISDRSNTRKILQSDSDCVGIAIFLDNDNKVVSDGRVELRSGYILVSETDPPSSTKGTRHMQVYKSVFRDIKERPDCYIFGFGLQNGCLKGRSNTFNSRTYFEQKLLNETKEGLFYFRLVTFGAILSYKFAHTKAPSPYCSALCLCLFQICKQCGDDVNLSELKIAEINIDHLDLMKVIFKQLGVHEQILKVSCEYEEMWRITAWARTKVAMYYLFKALREEMSQKEFDKLMSTVMIIFAKIDEFVEWLRTIIFGEEIQAPSDVDLDALDDYKEDTIDLDDEKLEEINLDQNVKKTTITWSDVDKRNI